MSDTRKSYSIIQLNDWSERGWAVVDDTGAIVNVDGLAIRLTKEEAKEMAARKNLDEPRSETPDD